jgi:methanogenic corrinoid protein MtbC1/DNA-binding CsgD family transcriptional regulator
MEEGIHLQSGNAVTLETGSAQQLFDIVATGSQSVVASFIRAEFGTGRTPGELITDVLAPVQREIGDHWHHNLWTVADEHVATALVEQVVTALASSAPDPPSSGRGRLAVVCAEREWHTLPARMAAELWRWDGWDVTFLGGSVPPEQVGRWLASARPDVLAISCSVSTAIPGVLRVAEVATDVGVACVAGGAGLGVDPRLARSLGMRWSATPAGLAAALDGPDPDLDWAALQNRRREADQLSSIVDPLADQALASLMAAHPGVPPYSEGERLDIRRDYRSILEFLVATVLCDDVRIFTGFLEWLQTMLTSRDLPVTVLPARVTALAGVLPRRHERSRYLCDQAVRWLVTGEHLLADGGPDWVVTTLAGSDREQGRHPNGAGATLGPREKLILELMASGLANRAIAEQLHLSVNTVRNHAQSILRKLSAHSRLEAVAIAVTEGIIRR